MIGIASIRRFSGSEAPPPTGPREKDAPDQALAPGHLGRVLIVEDDYLVALSNEWALTDAGFEVVACVPSGEEALVAARQARPDLVLMDIRLAGPMDGIDTALALCAVGIPSVFASANSDPGMVARGEAAEPLGWIRKPFTDMALIDTVKTAMDRLRGT